MIDIDDIAADAGPYDPGNAIMNETNHQAQRQQQIPAMRTIHTNGSSTNGAGGQQLFPKSYASSFSEGKKNENSKNVFDAVIEGADAGALLEPTPLPNSTAPDSLDSIFDPLPLVSVASAEGPGESNNNTAAMNQQNGLTNAAKQIEPTANSSTNAAVESSFAGESKPPAAAKPPPPPAAAASSEVIDLLDDDEEDDETDTRDAAANPSQVESNKRQKTEHAAAARNSYDQRNKYLGLNKPPGTRIVPGSTLSAAPRDPVAPAAAAVTASSSASQQNSSSYQNQRSSSSSSSYGSNGYGSNPQANKPINLEFPPGFKPSWAKLMPDLRDMEREQRRQRQLQQQGGTKAYVLSLLNVNEFTITGVAPYEGADYVTTIAGLRKVIRQVAKQNGGKAVWERPGEGKSRDDYGDDEENAEPENRTGKWRIPLAAYQSLLGYLEAQPNTRVRRIAPHLLQMASLERARQEKGYPTSQELMKRHETIPLGLANALAPFQRGGVDFVVTKNGRALIADDMGLGKTIQGIASMTVYAREWPVLVLCPSSARYHWEAEFQNWLGKKSFINNKDSLENQEVLASKSKALCDSGGGNKTTNEHESSQENLVTNADSAMLLDNWQIHVISGGKDQVLPFKDTKVAVCSYGLATSLCLSGKLYAGQFRCAIVDESHMLKNSKAKRTSLLLPVLKATRRCVLLSGTPALARPAELWPQLEILTLPTDTVAMREVAETPWETQEDFLDKYVKRGGQRERAELHTMLTSTVMIRRLKSSILKAMPSKQRSKASLHVLNREERAEFKQLLAQLRESKGALGKIARKQYKPEDEPAEEELPPPAASANNNGSSTNVEQQRLIQALNIEFEQRLAAGRREIQHRLVASVHPHEQLHRHEIQQELENTLRGELGHAYDQRLQQIRLQHTWATGVVGNDTANADGENKRVSVLTRLYSRTGTVKIPLLVRLLEKWLQDPTKGKLCIFAHHIDVLNAIEKDGKLGDAGRKFIRIDGATLPKNRQHAIQQFQTDPSVRIALLGITAAGVAVTLTACSTVWFAELFWTPALMIQAEDRCHRIGQQARVQCLYFCARGTLDDVLWKLIEQKFKDLGEFVEGKEKLQLVVSKTYLHESELCSSLFPQEIAGDAAGDTDDGDLDDEEEGVVDILADDDFARDIEQLGAQECQAAASGNAEDGEDGISEDNDSKPAAVLNGAKPPPPPPPAPPKPKGQSEEEAISLLDDDDEAETAQKENCAASATTDKGGDASSSGQHNSAAAFSQSMMFQNSRMYQLHFDGPSLGLEMDVYHGRPVIRRVQPDRLERLGPQSMPQVGHVVVGFQGHPLPTLPSITPFAEHVKNTRNQLQQKHQSPSLSMTFVHCPLFCQYYEQRIAADERKRQAEIAARNKAAAENVIELD